MQGVTEHMLSTSDIHVKTAKEAHMNIWSISLCMWDITNILYICTIYWKCWNTNIQSGTSLSVNLAINNIKNHSVCNWIHGKTCDKSTDLPWNLRWSFWTSFLKANSWDVFYMLCYTLYIVQESFEIWMNINILHPHTERKESTAKVTMKRLLYSI